MHVERNPDSVAPPLPEASRGSSRVATFAARSAVFVALVYPAAWLTSRFWIVSDLITHFQEPFAIVTFASVAMLLRGRRGKFALVLSVLLGLQCYSIYRYLGPNPVAADPASNERLRILFANVYVANRHYDDLLRLIEAERPDIIGLVEYTPAWQKALEGLRLEYPYSAEAPSRVDAGGVALWFRKPPISLEPPRSLTPDGWPVAQATFEFAGQVRRIWVVHPFSPIQSDASRDGTHELYAIAEQAGSVEGSRIVIGDMNTTDGSARFRDFPRVARLRDGRQGFGRQRSWPVDSIYRIAIDHCFVSDDLAVVDRRLGPSIHSDHFPLIVDLAPASKRSRSSDSQVSSSEIKSP